MPNRYSLEFFHGASRFRFDSWHRLNDYAARLVLSRDRNNDITDLSAKTEKLLMLIQSLEDYTAFPSDEDFELIWHLFNTQNFKSFAWCINTVMRALSSGSYRTKAVNLVSALERQSDNSNDSRRSRTDVAEIQNKPYFEVLFVDKNSRQELPELKQGFSSLSHANDSFHYDLVAVPSFEDALIAVLFNYNIQACVINNEIPYRSKNHLPVLKSYLSSITDIDFEELTGQAYGPLLGELLSELRPELDLYLVTHESVESIAGRTAKTFRRIFYRQDDYLELHLNLLRGIQERYETPFFNALRAYRQKTNRRVSRYAYFPRQVSHQVPLDTGHGKLLRD